MKILKIQQWRALIAAHASQAVSKNQMEGFIKYLSVFLLFLHGSSSAQQVNGISVVPYGFEKVVLMRPTGETINDLPEMVMISDTTHLHRRVDDIVKNSFMNDAIDLYFLAATYLKNEYELDKIEPAYLALSENDGGFAKVGFVIRTESGHVDKRNVPYIDLTESRINANPNRLMSLTQLYPHEMGHLIYRMLNNNQNTYRSRSVDMHYFSVRTDYSTAFNEGFA